MTDLILTSPVELTDNELDFVSGGAATSGAASKAVGLIPVAAAVSAAADVHNLLNNNNVLDNNHVPVAVQVNILGGGVNG